MKYMFVCEHGDYRAMRSPNTKRCPNCGGALKRVEQLSALLSVAMLLAPIKKACEQINEPLSDAQYGEICRELVGIVATVKDVMSESNA